MKKLLIFVFFLLAGCTSTTTQYYEAVTAAANANATASQAKFDALAAIAASGDGQAASAAVMALALTQTPTINPVPQQSQALQWASILATPVTSLGMMWMQSDSAKTMAKYNADVSLARVQATSQSNAALYGTFADMNQATANVGMAGLDAAGNADYSAFIDGMVTLGTAGITGAVDLGTAGFGANVDIATAGMTGLVDLGTAGITGVVDMGNAGITGVTTVSLDAFDTLLNLDTGNNSLLEGVWTNYTTSIQDIIDGVPRLCQPITDANGVTTLVCE
jgi:hypothetical protein